MTESQGAHGDSEASADSDLTRGQFLTKASIGLGGLMGAMIAIPAAGMAIAPAVSGPKFKAVKLGDISEFEAAKGTFHKVVMNPGEGEFDEYVRKRVAFVRMNADPKSDKVAAAINYKGASQGEFSVISNRCAHLGCPVQESGGAFVCPCHGGAYNTNGIRTAGPPARSLDRFLWERRDDQLWAVDEYSVSLKGSKEKLHGPGQHAGDAQGLLYPLQP